MKTIFTVYVPMESQEQCDRMKKACADDGLPIYKNEILFDIDESYFEYNPIARGFSTWRLGTETQVTETEFMELLKEYKNQ